MKTPKKTKFRKYQKPKITGIKSNNTELKFGEYGIKSLSAGIIPLQTIETIRILFNREFKRTGIIYIRIFPDRPITRKPSQVRMGKGKGNTAFWVAAVKKGEILFELKNVEFEKAKKASFLCNYKLGIKTKFICLKS